MADILEEELSHWPGVTFFFITQHRHPRLYVSVNGASRFLPYSRTYTTKKGIKNCVAWLRRLLVELGATRA